MSDDDDLYDVTQPPITDELAERLVSGSGSEPDTASLRELDALFASLGAQADPSELASLHAVVSAFQGAVVTSQAGSSAGRTRPMLKKLLTTKTIACIGAVTVISAGAAAAATDTLPSPFASEAAEEVTAERVPDVAREAFGKHVDGADGPDEDEDEDDVVEAVEEADDEVVEVERALAADAVGPDVTGPAKFGLCTAAANHEQQTDGEAVPTTSSEVPVAFRNLTDAAAAAGQTVEEFCADATPGQSTSAPGRAEESPSATAPGRGEQSPAATAPGRADEGPSATAPGRSVEGPSATAPGQSGQGASGVAPASTGGANPSVTAPGKP